MTNYIRDESNPYELTQSGECIDGDQFDWKTIRVLCVSGIPKHKAYGMSLSEYKIHRTEYFDADDSERMRLSFRMPAFAARLTSDLAIDYDLTHIRFLTFVIELGLISIQHDYHDEYSNIRRVVRKLPKIVSTEEHMSLYSQLIKHTISLDSSSGSRSGSRSGGARHFTPNVPEWLHNAITDKADYLNMSITDLVYLCWCVGINSSIESVHISNMFIEENKKIISHFKLELKHYNDYIEYIKIKINIP